MRAGKNPSVAQKKAIAKANLDPNLWLIRKVDDKAGTMDITNRETGEVKTIKKAG
jgi:hypothetical protein